STLSFAESGVRNTGRRFFCTRQGMAVSSPPTRLPMKIAIGVCEGPHGHEIILDVIRRDFGQSCSDKIRACSALRGSDFIEIRSRTRSNGPSVTVADVAKFWTHDAAVCSALSFQRVHQQ